MNTDQLRIVIVGVGGQGVLSAAKNIGGAMLEAGHSVVMSEVHGMAQRGGVVVCNICIGDLDSSLIGDGQADIILSFEPIEAYRALNLANKDTVIISNMAAVIPVTASIGEMKYPDLDDIFAAISEVNSNFIKLEATELAKEAGTALAANTVMLGALAATGKLPISTDELKNYMLSKVPPKTVEMNEKAFGMGMACCD